MNRIFQLSLLLSLVVTFFVSGCSDKVGPPTGPGSTSVTVPKTGSVFIYKAWELDSNGVQVPGTVIFDTERVLATGLQYEGKSNVSEMISQGKPVYISYESNGDISIFYQGGSSAGSRSGWQTMPVASKSPTTMTEFDTTYPNGSIDRHDLTITYTGESNVNLAGQTFDALSFQIEDVFTPSSEYNSTETDWFAPGIGWDIKSHSDYQHHQNGEEVELQSYTLK